ncbi:hypothetical protein SAMN05444285_1264 [Draconibacterium orientale]|jgi:tetratricopeptide (TPR) repeat protein|uniref:Uncharacterized protein n=1 Tax=Draconibacterium orientale TaxID=1168034 RepID=X5DGZ3_9BACT|nr:hypothetical protein [Draconibacterium orientale]AHW62258.1 hypothetical protein FH5T_18490 [Draconibacterium orientale]SET85947.1 hypothetical protein SAMN05444285_1264 [Draconibacterium orientale]
MENIEIENSLKVIEDLLKTEKAEQARKLFEELEEQNSVRYFLLKGKIEQKYQNWGEAINAFSRVLDMEPGNTEAINNLHLIKNILNFWNPDLLNP